MHAVREVSLEVREGELVGLIGPNGAGKTTLIDAVTGFVGFSGTVELNGSDISRLPAYERAGEGLARTWQSTELFDDLDVSENLTVATAHLKAANGPIPAAGDTLALVGMDWAAEAMPTQLSAGQRKLVGVGRALAARPHVLCLDEPAAGLDTTESVELGDALRTLADQGQTMLLIEHDMGLVMSICDRVVVLEFGQVIADGPPEEVRGRPARRRRLPGGVGHRRARSPGPDGAGRPARLVSRRNGPGGCRYSHSRDRWAAPADFCRTFVNIQRCRVRSDA